MAPGRTLRPADPATEKSTVEEIRKRFDGDVDRFSNLSTGQQTTLDAALVLELVTDAAAAANPEARRALDVGCGAGNYSLKLLQKIPDLDIDLLDLSRPMLERAHLRVQSATHGSVRTIQTDIREAELGSGRYDVIIAAATLHHLRTDAEWEGVFASFHRALRPGGSVWIVDLVEHQHPAIQEMMRAKYGAYLSGLGGPAFRDEVFGYIQREDSPRSLDFQLDLLKRAGISTVEVLHFNTVFAAFGGIKPPS